MIKQFPYRIFLSLLFWLTMCFVHGQEITKPYEYDKEELTSARDGIDYSDDVFEDREKEKPNYNDSDYESLGNFLGFLLIIFLVGLVFIILYFRLEIFLSNFE